MKFAYADPPYIGQARKHYKNELLCAEVDHKLLIEQLMDNYTDGWALSLSSPSLQEILPLCPSKIRVMAWVKPFCAFKVNVNPAYAWEPVLVYRGRKRSREQVTVRDWVSENIAMKKGLSGAKPENFCWWICQVLNVVYGDTLDDLFPGTGIMGEVFQAYCQESAAVRDRSNVRILRRSVEKGLD